MPEPSSSQSSFVENSHEAHLPSKRGRTDGASLCYGLITSAINLYCDHVLSEAALVRDESLVPSWGFPFYD